MEPKPAAVPESAAFLLEVVYIQLHRTVRRALGVIGDLERDGMNPWQKQQRTLRYMGSLDAEIFAIRDHVEDLAKALGITLPTRGEAHDRSRGANASPATPNSKPPTTDLGILAP